MSYEILVQILDGDMHGKLGGTQYRLTVSNKEKIIESYDYSLMDEIKGNFNSTSIIKKYADINKSIEDELAKSSDEISKKLKSEKLDSMKSKVISDDSLIVIKNIIDENEKLVDSFKSGADKALNALVGKCIKELKIKSLDVDPLKIKIEIEKLIN